MKRLLPALAAAALAAALLVPAAASARLHVTFRYLGVNPKTGRVVDRPPREESPGDVIDFRYTLLVPRGVAGTAFFHFRYTSRKRISVAVRLRFREGTVLARGALNSNASRARLRVTGGTGVFRRSRGVVDVRDTGGDRLRVVLRLR